MSVVRRCPNCGTTQPTAGECEACHEAQVRYFCSNHTPGLWLDAPLCAKCGAHFGAPARPASTPAPVIPMRARPVAPAPEAAPARERKITAPSTPYSRAARATPSSDAWSSRGPVPVTDDDRLEVSPSPRPLWQQLLGAFIRARYMPGATTLPARSGAGGCLRRLLLLAAVLFVGLLIAVFLFGRALFHSVQPY